MKKIKIIFFTLPLLLSVGVHADSPEDVAIRFSTALNELDAKSMVEELHPEMLEFFHGFTLHLAATIEDEEERQDYLEQLGVKSLDELEGRDSKWVSLRFYEMGFSHVSPAFREASRSASTRIIGSLEDEGITYVVYRTDVSIEEMATTVPSVILLKPHEGRLKVMNTTQMETVRARAAAQGFDR